MSVEIEHRYGNHIHILNHGTVSTWLEKLCSPRTTQPEVNFLIRKIYQVLLTHVLEHEFPRTLISSPTRMAEFHPKEGILSADILNPETATVTVDLARAGTLPSLVCYEELNHLLNPAKVRQDHLGMSRQTDQSEQVQGTVLHGHKIGGPIDQSIVLIPDPMGATGGTIQKAIETYRDFGKPLKIIAMHCIVTPEYLRTISQLNPAPLVYAARLDRGLSGSEILDSVPGTQWEKERGLNDKQYIVPGGGGFGGDHE